MPLQLKIIHKEMTYIQQAPDKVQQQLMELRYNNLTNKWKICSVINSIVLSAKSF